MGGKKKKKWDCNNEKKEEISQLTMLGASDGKSQLSANQDEWKRKQSQ